MKKNHPTYFFTLFIFFCTLNIQAQNHKIVGAVTDSIGFGLPAATIALMQAQDSVLSAFGIADTEGRFELEAISAGDYLIQVSYVGYETFWQPLAIKEGLHKTDIGRLILNPSSAVLDEVEVTAEHIPLSMRNDTLVYNANAFKTQPGSVVEDLLKKLPGVEVERDGTVKAQGETVQKVLVDGKEFFGDDPKIATKNLPADAVEKVQVFDKQSDMAAFTGIEDGRDVKTINLELKDGKKNGYFGNASAGAGGMETQDGTVNYDRYQGRFNVNRFSGKSQLSSIGLLNNTNQEGFSFDEYIRFMGGLSNFLSGGSGGSGGRMRLSFDPMSMGIPMEGAGLDQGFTTTSAVGLNLNHDFSKKTALNASYFYSNIKNDLSRIVSKESLLADENFSTEEMEDRQSKNQNHRLNTTLRHEIDSFQNIILRANVGFNDAALSSLGETATFDTAEGLENQSFRDYIAESQNLSLSSDLTYRRRFREKGRAFVANASWGMERDDREGTLRAENIFGLGNDAFTELTDQEQQFKDAAGRYGLSGTYTEPLGKSTKHKSQYLAITAARQNYSNQTRKEFYDRENNQAVLNTLLSRRYNRDYIYDRGGLDLMINRKKYNLTLGADIQQSNLKGLVVNENTAIQNKFTRVLPSLFFDYEFGPSRGFSLEYLTSVREPSLEQLQPLIDNSDPLNVFSGNPDLQPEYQHLMEGEFMLFDQFTFTSLFANVQASYTSDRITNASSVDSLFRQFIQPINVDHDYTLSGGFQFRTPIRPIETNIRLSFNTYWNKGFLFVNGLENEVNRQQHSIRLSFDNRKKDLIDFTIGGRISFNKTAYSISDQLDQSFMNQKLYSDLLLLPNEFWEFSTSLDYTVYSAETFGEKRTIPIWKAGLTRYVLKNKRGKISLMAFDLLNKNIGINRNSQLNYIQEERTLSLGRHVMLRFAYAISGFNKEPGGIEITVDRDR